MAPADGTSPEEEHRLALNAALEHTDLTLEQLWTRYFALGGEADLVEVEAHLAGLVLLPAAQRDVLAHAVNERLDELIWRRRVPYSRPIRQGRPTTGPLAALVELLKAPYLAPPDRLPYLAAAAGRALGVEVAVHLVDHEQRRLVRLPSRNGNGGEEGAGSLSIDGTLPGRVFQTLRTLPSEGSGRPRLWVPVQDGADRLGVLEFVLSEHDDLYDPGLREQCGWLASMVGHLVAAMGQYGDELERARRTRPRTPSAELLWQQLPPLTVSSDTFVLAGMLEPSYQVGGDAFDFALSEHTVSLAIFDAVGHSLDAGLLAAATLAAYRSSRRAGRSLEEQARAIDGVIATSFGASAFVTGVLAELDVASGRLRYLGAGHPAPLLLRGGRVVKKLTGGRRMPFGLATPETASGEEVLQPGDWLALYTDGITEARNAVGAWFGEQRLEEFLTRAVAADQPPPETVRRLTRTVLDHQGGLLQDDACILLASWTSASAS